MRTAAARRERLLLSLRCAGLDVLHQFAVDPSARALLPPWTGSVPMPWGLLIGNTKALWPHFLNWLRQQPHPSQLNNPLDTYVVERVVEAAAQLAPHSHELFFSHQLTYRLPFSQHPSAIPIQRLAEAVGLATLGPPQLSVHPSFGPWLSLRAVLIADMPAPRLQRPRAWQPCAGCSAPCRPALRTALAAAQGPPSAQKLRNDWQPWVALRDSCPVGRGHRYSSSQLEYHYTKHRRTLGLV